MLDRFTGEALVKFRDGSSEVRRVVILSPYIQTSKDLRDIDYDHSLVVDLQTMEFEFKNQIEEMLNNQELSSYNTFIDYANKITFRNGENVLAWLHRMKQITRVPADDVSVVFGQGGNTQKMPVSLLNGEIKAQNQRKLAELESKNSSYTDPSMNAENIMPATIEKSGNAHSQQNHKLAENTEATETPVENKDPVNQEPVNVEPGTMEVDVSKVPGVTILEGTESPESSSDTTPLEGHAPTRESDESASQYQEKMDALVTNFEKLEKLVSKRTKDTLVTRLMDKYDLTETEVVKAVESAGQRKEKRLKKEQEKSQKQ